MAATEESVAHLREYLLARLDKVEALFEAAMKAQATALGLQTGELARRLENLNNENARIASFQNQHITRELYDAQHRELKDMIVDLERRVESLGEFRANILGKQGVVTGVVSLLVSLIVVLLSKVL